MTITQKEISQIKKAIKEVKAYIISKDYELYSKGIKEYKESIIYNDCFIDDFKSISLFTKNLIGNKNNGNDILVNNILAYHVKEKYGISLKEFDCLTSGKYFNFLIDNINNNTAIGSHCKSKIDNFFKGYLKSKC